MGPGPRPPVSVINGLNETPGCPVTRRETSYRRRRLVGMRIGAHVDPAEPLTAAADRKADVVQFFLTDPQGYKSP